jgi:hypothetical protein
MMEFSVNSRDAAQPQTLFVFWGAKNSLKNAFWKLILSTSARRQAKAFYIHTQ